MAVSDAACLFAGNLGDLAAALADPVILMNTSGDLRWGNAAAEKLFGVTLADGLGRNMLEFLHPDDVEIALVAVESMERKDVGTLLELRVKCAEGWALLEVRGTTFGDDILLSVRDISDRRRWEVAGDEAAGFRALIQNAASITLVLERAGEIRSSSSVVTRLLGHDQELLERASLSEIVDRADRDTLVRALQTVSATDARPVTVDLRLLHRNGDTIPFAVTFTNLLDDPSLAGVVVTGHDISDRVEAEHELRESNSLLATTLEATIEGILVVDHTGHITSFNRRCADMWQIPTEELEARDDARALKRVLEQVTDPGACMAVVRELVDNPDATTHDIMHCKTGRVIERNSQPRRLDGVNVGRVWSFRDITEHERLKQQLAHQALHDALTGLPNKSLFRDRIDQAVTRLNRSQNQIAVLFVDLDDFKNVNDTLGHWAGDALLVQLSDRLTNQLRRSDTGARLGGDEFAVLVDDIADAHVAVDVAHRIIEALREPIVIATRRLMISASIGIAFGNMSADTDELLRNADIAMYAAKAEGKNCSRVFTPDMHASAVDRLDSATTTAPVE